MHNPLDSSYRNHPAIYEEQASAFLVHCLNKYRVPACGHGLDLGCGTGHDTLYLARRGYAMCGIDASASDIASLARRADMLRLPVLAQVGDLRTLHITPNKYQLIIANAALDYLPPDAATQLAQQIQEYLAPDAYLYASVALVNHPSFALTGAGHQETGSEGRHYYQPGELRTQFSALTVLAYQEEYALDSEHEPTQYQGTARLFARRSV
jgi:tellurite methyltransferase